MLRYLTFGFIFAGTVASTKLRLRPKISCKGVRCPPIFSLSNLINVGWLVRKCVDIYIYIHPLIAGTNRKAFCCMLALR